MRSGVVWSTLTYAAGRGLTVLTTIVLARLLAPSQFGLVAAVLAFLSVIELASDLGMNATVVYEQQKGRTDRLDVAFTLNLIFALVLAGLGVALAPAVADLFQLGSHAGLFRLGALSLVLTGCGNIHDAVLLREMEFRRRAIPELANSVVRGGVSIALAVTGSGATSLVIGMLAGSAAWTVAQWILTKYRPRLSLDRKIVRSMASYGSAAVVFEVIAVLSNRVDQLVIARVLGQASLGLYTVAMRVPEMAIDSVTWNVSLVAFPDFARKRAADEGSLGGAAVGLLRYQALYAVPASIGLAIIASPLVVVLFGSKWRPAGDVMSAISLMSGIAAMVFPLGDVFKALGRQRTLIALTLVQVPFFVGVVIAVAPYGIVAVAWVRVGASAVSALVQTFFVMRAAHIRLADLVRSLKPAASATVGVVLTAGSVRLLWSSLTVGPLILAAAAGLVGGCIGLRVLAPAALSELRAMIPRARQSATPTAVQPEA